MVGVQKTPLDLVPTRECHRPLRLRGARGSLGAWGGRGAASSAGDEGNLRYRGDGRSPASGGHARPAREVGWGSGKLTLNLKSETYVEITSGL